MDMKNINILKSAVLSLAAAALFTACDYDDATEVALVELGSLQKEYIIDEDGGAIEIQVYSNGAYHIESLDNAPWVSLDRTSGNGDGVINATVTMNEEFKRMSRIVLCSDVDERKDTVSLKQEGALPAALSKENTSIIIPGAGGETVDYVNTNIPFSYMKVVKTYPHESDPDWIKDITIDDNTVMGNSHELIINTDPNTNEKTPRTASVVISYTDGWGDEVEVNLNIVQRNAKEGIGEAITFKELKDVYATGKVIEDYVVLEGIVVSNTEGGNAGENEQVSASAIDYTVSERTVYLEEPEKGLMGAMLVTKTSDDNIFKQYDKVQILLHGATADLLSEPDRINVKDITKNMVISQVAGSKGDVPLKEKHMNELTDDDLYTYVTLLDVELPVRKGALAPVNEGYTLATNANYLSKAPILLRDINADHMYILTNTVCRYRNDGTRLPYGSGKISGVIVHERHSRFDWKEDADLADVEDDVTLGNIGRYELRHQNKEDIWSQMNDSVEDSFSALLTEYRYWYPDIERQICLPTYGENGWLTHTYQEKYTHDPAKEYLQTKFSQHMWGGGTYIYLGPMGNNVNYMFGDNWGNHNGCGIIIDPAKEHFDTEHTELSSLVSYNPDGTIEWCGPYATSKDAVNNSSRGAGGINNHSTSMCGKSNVYGACYTSFASHYWWDYDTNRPHAWIINFSTEGISTDHISMQISVMNTQQSFYSPRFWRAEWSLIDSMEPKDDSQWHTIGDYTIPDVCVWGNTLISSNVQYKPIDFELPLEILGHENVYIRLRPTSDACSDGSNYSGSTLSGNSAAAHASNLEYFAIRYNK